MIIAIATVASPELERIMNPHTLPLLRANPDDFAKHDPPRRGHGHGL